MIDSCAIVSIELISDVYHILKKRVPITEQFITIGGEAVDPRITILVKRYSLLSEAFITCTDFTMKLVDVYLNGIMMGKKVNTLKYVINNNLKGVIINKKEDLVENPCINCGLCVKYCPVNLNPKYVKDKNGIVKEIYKKGCLGCSLCNRVCPSHINLKKYMMGDLDG